MGLNPKVILGAVGFVFGLIHMSMLAHYVRCSTLGFALELATNLDTATDADQATECLATCASYANIQTSNTRGCTWESFETIQNDGLAYNDPLGLFSYRNYIGVLLFQLLESVLLMFAGLLTLVGLKKEGASAGADTLWWATWPVAWLAFGFACWYINVSVCVDSSLTADEQATQMLEYPYYCFTLDETALEGRQYPVIDSSTDKYALDIELGSDGVGSFIKAQMAFAMMNFFIVTIMAVLNIVGVGGTKVQASP